MNEMVNPSSVLYGGWLDKQSDWMGSYRPRFAQILSNGDLVYYLTDEDETPRGRMPLKDAAVEVCDCPENDFLLRLASRKTLRLRASSLEERDQWMSLIASVGASENRSETEDTAPVETTDDTSLNAAGVAAVETADAPMEDVAPVTPPQRKKRRAYVLSIAAAPIFIPLCLGGAFKSAMATWAAAETTIEDEVSVTSHPMPHRLHHRTPSPPPHTHTAAAATPTHSPSPLPCHPAPHRTSPPHSRVRRCQHQRQRTANVFSMRSYGPSGRTSPTWSPSHL